MSIVEVGTFLLKGLGTTLATVVAATLLALVLAFLVGILRTTRWKILNAILTIYVEVFRGSSVLVQLFWIYFVFPFFNIKLSAYVTAVLAIGLNYGAYGSEVVRSAIRSVPKTQLEACAALNMNGFLRMRRVVLPQAIVVMMPSFGNLQIELIKATSLVSMVTLSDLTYYATVLNNRTMQTTTIYLALLIIYYLVTRPFAFGTKKLEKKLSIWRA